MSGLSAPRVDSSSSIYLEPYAQQQSQPITRKRIISQEQINDLILITKAAWAKDAEKNRSSSITASPFPPAKKCRIIDEDHETPSGANEGEQTLRLTQRNVQFSPTLSSETIADCQSLKEKIEGTIKLSQAPEISAVNQKWKRSISSLLNPADS